MTEFRCFDTYVLNNYSSSDYTKKKKRKTLFENAQTIAIGNSNYQQGISVNAIPPGYLPKTSGGTYYAPVYVGTKGTNRCLLGANSYDLLYDVLYGSKPYNDTYKQIAIDITDSLPIPPQDWVGNMMQINFKSDANPDSIIGPAICDIPANGSPNKMDYAARQDFLPKYDDIDNPPINFPGMMIDPSYNIFYPQCPSKYKTNNYYKNIKYNSSILFSSKETLPQTISFLNNKLYQNVKAFPYPLDFNASKCLTLQELIDLIFPPPPPPPTFFDASGAMFDGICNDIVYNNGIWIAVGTNSDGNTILRSIDGINWHTVGGTLFVEEGKSLGYDSTTNVWIATGDSSDGNCILKSTNNGLTWTPIIIGITPIFTGNSITYNNGVWVVVGSSYGGNTIYYSNDALTWNNILGTQFDIRGNYLQYGGGKWVAVGEDTNDYNILYSLDGQNWQIATGSTFLEYGNKVVFGGKDRWVAVGNSIGGDKILTSSNGMNWTSTTGSSFTMEGISVSYGGGAWVAVGDDSGGNNTILASGNGLEWTEVSGITFNQKGNSVYYGGGRWVAVGSVTGAADTILSSTNGFTDWTATHGEQFPVRGNFVTYNDNLWVAGGGKFLYGYSIIV